MKLYHGSINEIKKPVISAGKVHNDFGQGFYCTEDFDLAAEWACQRNSSGYVNSYELNATELKVLDLLDGNYSVLNWIALLLKNRFFDMSSDAAMEVFTYITDNFTPDTSDIDLIIGYRADDSYFSYAASFLNNGMSLQSLSKALRLGELGEQVVLKSKRAFNNLNFISAHNVNADEYYKKFISRDTAARINYQKLKSKPTAINGVYAINIIQEGFEQNDTRLRPFILKRR